MKPLAASTAVLFLALAMAQTPTPPPPAPAPVSLRQLSESLEHLSTRVHNAVVQVFSTGYAAPDENDTTNASLLSKQSSTGSGVVLSSDGYIVTNSHVIRGARRIEVRLPAERVEIDGRRVLKPKGRTVEATVVGIDRVTDLAVIKIPATGLKYLTLGNSDDLRQGELVMAFGNPLGLEGSVSLGIVSSPGRQIKFDDPMIYIQTDAPINPGNSGGPLVNSEGLVMGINTFILTQSGGSEGLGFAIPSNVVDNVYKQIRKEGHVHRGQIGISVQTITPAIAAGLDLPQDWGVVVGDVTPDGPSDTAGVKIGDVIVTLDGRTMQSARQVEVAVHRHPAHEKLKLELLRGKDKVSAEVEVVEGEQDPERFADMVTPDKNLVEKLGILCIPIDKKLAGMLPELRKSYGLVVAAGSVRDLSTGTGLQVGDVIYSVDGEPVTDVPTLRARLAEFKPGEAPVFQIERDSRLIFVAIEIE